MAVERMKVKRGFSRVVAGVEQVGECKERCLGIAAILRRGRDSCIRLRLRIVVTGMRRRCHRRSRQSRET